MSYLIIVLFGYLRASLVCGAFLQTEVASLLFLKRKTMKMESGSSAAFNNVKMIYD